MARRGDREGDTLPGRRAIWKGTLAFGLVSMPVRLYRAVEQRGALFHELHDEDGGRIRHRSVCSLDGADVPYEHIVKGFAAEPGRWITVTSAELRALAPAPSQAIEIVEIVNPADIEPMLYDQAYWLVPGEGSARPYALLTRVMTELRRTAIARLTLRGRRHVCAIRPVATERVGTVLSLSTLHYVDEVLPANDLAGLWGTPTAPSERELQLAERLVESLSGHFHPERYRDEQREEVLAYLQQKAQGTSPLPSPQEALAPPSPVDLAGALEASLAEAARHRTAA